MQATSETTRRDLLKLVVLAGIAVALHQTDKALDEHEGDIEYLRDCGIYRFSPVKSSLRARSVRRADASYTCDVARRQPSKYGPVVAARSLPVVRAITAAAPTSTDVLGVMPACRTIVVSM